MGESVASPGNPDVGGGFGLAVVGQTFGSGMEVKRNVI